MSKKKPNSVSKITKKVFKKQPKIKSENYLMRKKNQKREYRTNQSINISVGDKQKVIQYRKNRNKNILERTNKN